MILPLYIDINTDEFENLLENKYMSNGYMKKSISWYQLYKRIGKQTLHKTRNTKVQVFIDGELKECALVFTNNGSDFHLEPVGTVK